MDLIAYAKGKNNIELLYGEDVNLEVEAYSATGELSYQWYYGGRDASDRTILEGATESSLKITGDENVVASYYCRVTDGVNEEWIFFSVLVDTGIVVESEYQRCVSYGDSITISVTATGGKNELSYQWYYYDKEQGGRILIENATESSYVVTGTKDMPSDYICMITDGIMEVSEWIYVELDTGIEVTFDDDEVHLESGETTTLRVQASGGAGALTYQWYYYDEEKEEYLAIAGATEKEYEIIGRKADWSWYGCYVSDGIVMKRVYFDVYVEAEDGVEENVDLEEVGNVTLEYTTTTYNGSVKIPQVMVKDGTVVLVAHKDYTVVYDNNKNVGTATVTITGNGAYTGTLVTNFEIQTLSLTDTMLTLSESEYTYDGTAKTPAVVVKAGERTLVAGTDYTVAYSNNTNVGTATITVTGIGNYSGTIKKTFVIKEKVEEPKQVSIAGAAISLPATGYNYDGTAKEPVVTVKVGNTVLAKDTDYVVTYSNNINIGTATVMVTGKGNYTGTAQTTFEIVVEKGASYVVGAYKYKITDSDTVAFAGVQNSKTKKVTIAKSVTIGGKVFHITSIANKALHKKKKVTSVTIGANVTKIGKEAFKNCSKLKTITIKSKKLKSIGKNSFKGIYAKATIKVPSAKLKAYKKLFKNKGLSSKAKIKK